MTLSPDRMSSSPPVSTLPARVMNHPLPSGMRDLLPREARTRRAVARAFLEHAAIFGYEAIETPAFEYADTIERGLGMLDPGEIVRFVEPESGEVVALRPDVTPQIARIVATRLADRPAPYRLAYDAAVLRRRAGSRARTHRQVLQVGVELVGVEGIEGDLELLRLAASSLRTMGLSSFTIDVGHAETARQLLVGAPFEDARAIADALAKKDLAAIDLATKGLGAAARAAILELPRLHGPSSLLDDPPPALLRAGCGPAIDSLRSLCARLTSALSAIGAPGVSVGVDLGEVRGLAYYTGPFFQLFADGPGVAIGGGGRYDRLLARFGRPLPATGLALDVDALTWALEVARSRLLEAPRRVVIAAGEGAFELAETVRATGVPAIVVALDGALSYARAWDWPVVAVIEGGELVIHDLVRGTLERVPRGRALEVLG
jgi:ATP phosphoribosyltransferase regulatory subunit